MRARMSVHATRCAAFLPPFFLSPSTHTHKTPPRTRRQPTKKRHASAVHDDAAALPRLRDRDAHQHGARLVDVRHHGRRGRLQGVLPQVPAVRLYLTIPPAWPHAVINLWCVVFFVRGSLCFFLRACARFFFFAAPTKTHTHTHTNTTRASPLFYFFLKKQQQTTTTKKPKSGQARTIDVNNNFDSGNTVVPWAGKLTIDPSKVELSGGATREVGACWSLLYRCVEFCAGARSWACVRARLPPSSHNPLP